MTNPQNAYESSLFRVREALREMGTPSALRDVLYTAARKYFGATSRTPRATSGVA